MWYIKRLFLRNFSLRNLSRHHFCTTFVHFCTTFVQHYFVKICKKFQAKRVGYSGTGTQGTWQLMIFTYLASSLSSKFPGLSSFNLARSTCSFYCSFHLHFGVRQLVRQLVYTSLLLIISFRFTCGEKKIW